MPALCQQLDLWWNQWTALMQFVQTKGETFCGAFSLSPLTLIFSLFPRLLPSLHPSLHMTLSNPPLGFPLTEGQPGRIYTSEIKKGERRKKKKKANVGALRKDCISRREPQDRHTGQQTASTDTRQLPFMHTRQRDQSVLSVKEIYKDTIRAAGYEDNVWYLFSFMHLI